MTSNFFKEDVAHSSNKMDWGTPQDLFDKLNNEFHFDLDAAADENNHKCEKYFTEADDALKQDWVGNVFLNPPYGRAIGKFIKKAYEETLKSANVVVIVMPARTDTAYWHDYIIPYAEVIFVRGRLKFTGREDGDLQPAPFPSAIVIFRKNLNLPRV